MREDHYLNVYGTPAPEHAEELVRLGELKAEQVRLATEAESLAFEGELLTTRLGSRAIPGASPFRTSSIVEMFSGARAALRSAGFVALLKGASEVGAAVQLGVEILKTSRDPELRESSLAFGEHVREYTGSDVGGALAATWVHVQASTGLALAKTVKEAAVAPVKNVVNHVSDSPGKSAALWLSGPIGWAALALPW